MSRLRDSLLFFGFSIFCDGGIFVIADFFDIGDAGAFNFQTVVFADAFNERSGIFADFFFRAFAASQSQHGKDHQAGEQERHEFFHFDFLLFHNHFEKNKTVKNS